MIIIHYTDITAAIVYDIALAAGLHAMATCGMSCSKVLRARLTVSDFLPTIVPFIILITTSVIEGSKYSQNAYPCAKWKYDQHVMIFPKKIPCQVKNEDANTNFAL